MAEQRRKVPASVRRADFAAASLVRLGGWVAPILLGGSAAWLSLQAIGGGGGSWARVFGWLYGSVALGACGIAFASLPALVAALLARRVPLESIARVASALPLSVPAFVLLRQLGPYLSQRWGLPAQHPLWAVLALAWGLAMPLWLSFSDALEGSARRGWSEGALALGAAPEQVLWSLSLPAAIPAIAAALLRAVARASGETMAVLLISGNFSSGWGGAEGASSVGVALALDLPDAVAGGVLWTDLMRGALALSIWAMCLHALAQRLDPALSDREVA